MFDAHALPDVFILWKMIMYCQEHILESEGYFSSRISTVGPAPTLFHTKRGHLVLVSVESDDYPDW